MPRHAVESERRSCEPVERTILTLANPSGGRAFLFCLMNKSPIALIGFGRWGENILRDLRALGEAVVVVDSNDARRAAASAAGADATYADADSLPMASGIVIATPATTHAEITIPLISRGVPVLVEKPLATDVRSAREIVDQGGSHVFVGHIWCYHPGVRVLAEIARSGELGPVHGLKSVRTNWTSPRQDVDSTWNLAPHDLSIAQFIFGKLPVPRFATAELLHGRCVGLSATLGETPWVIFEVSNRY